MRNFKFEEAILFAFKNESVKSLPKAVNKNSCFCIDLNEFQLKNVLADDNGAYSQYGNKRKYYEIRYSANKIEIEYKGLSLTNKLRNSENIYKADKSFYKCKSNEDFSKKTIRVQSIHDKSKFDKLVVGYMWKPNPKTTEVNVKPHGNATKVERPYLRMPGTILDSIKRISLESGSATVKFNKIFSECKKFSPSSLPRHTEQLYKHKSMQLNSNSKNKNSNDEYADALVNRQKSN